jgi:hypothetical protein
MDTIKGRCRALSEGGFGYSLNEEGHIYINEGIEYPMWIDFIEELSAIRIFSYAKVKAKSFDEIDALRLANRMNMNFIPLQVFYHDECVYCCHTIFLYEKISDRVLIDTLGSGPINQLEGSRAA